MKKQTKQFQAFEHTADIGLRIYGKDLAELFANAAFGLLSLITASDVTGSTRDLMQYLPVVTPRASGDPKGRPLTTTKGIKAASEITIELNEENREELLVAWLNEVLFYVTTRNFRPNKISIDAISDRALKARLKGQAKTDALLTEIKAATYHELEIKETPQGLEARVVFDT